MFLLFTFYKTFLETWSKPGYIFTKGWSYSKIDLLLHISLAILMGHCMGHKNHFHPRAVRRPDPKLQPCTHLATSLISPIIPPKLLHKEFWLFAKRWENIMCQEAMFVWSCFCVSSRHRFKGDSELNFPSYLLTCNSRHFVFSTRGQFFG